MENFKLTDETTVEDFEAALAAVRTFVVEEPTARQWRIHDSFDWRLYNKSLMLGRSGTEYALVPFDGGKIVRCDVADDQPMFVWELPESELRQKLTPILKARALLEVAAVYVEENAYRILNADEKTVVEAAYVTLRMAPGNNDPATATYLSLRPIRGYDAHARRLAKALGLGTKIRSVDEAIYHDALAAAARTPNSYSAKLDFQLDPKQRADEATKIILRRLLETMRANEAGICDDIDIEYLHDYRVAIRRTRSALSQIRGVFPAELTDRFKKEFRTLGSRTNKLRDMDVYLLAEADYRAMLPRALWEDIDPLFDLLRTERAAAIAHVIEGLNTVGYEQVLSAWAQFLDQPGRNDPTAPNAGIPVIELARKRIYKRYRRIVVDGTYILDHTEDELLHALRLECKKLRYLMEFFASLFPRKQVRRLINQLKGLQENLGAFTDLSVQQESLMAMADQLPDDDPRTRRALIATGALVETLARRQQAVKADFAATFTHFAAPANQQAYRDLFAPRKKPKKVKKQPKGKGKAS